MRCRVDHDQADRAIDCPAPMPLVPFYLERAAAFDVQCTVPLVPALKPFAVVAKLSSEEAPFDWPETTTVPNEPPATPAVIPLVPVRLIVPPLRI